MSKKENNIIVFDTTLRDGEQAPGGALSIKQKVDIALYLELLGVDVIEAGFASSSAKDTKGIQEIGKNVSNTIICSLSRAVESDIIASAQALKFARSPRIHVFISTSEIHLKYQFYITQDEALQRIRETVKLARHYVEDVQWSAMDATRTEINFLLKAIEVAIESGARTINIPDTVGYATPEEMGLLIKEIKNRVPNIDKAVISVHCHNDLGLAVANTLSALSSGARQFEATINGIGERAGNAALEEVVMAIKTRNTYYPFTTKIKTKYFSAISQMVSKYTGFVVQKNKAIVGGNAFLHASGIHQDGILKHHANYEIIDPLTVGFDLKKIVLSRHSGRAAFKYYLNESGYFFNDLKLEKLFSLFKKLAEKKKIISIKELLFLIEKYK